MIGSNRINASTPTHSQPKVLNTKTNFILGKDTSDYSTSYGEHGQTHIGPVQQQNKLQAFQQTHFQLGTDRPIIQSTTQSNYEWLKKGQTTPYIPQDVRDLKKSHFSLGTQK